MADLRILFWGMEGPFSREPLAALLAAGIEICALFVPQSDRAITDTDRVPPPTRTDRAMPASTDTELSIVAPYINQTTIHLAWEHGIPVWAVGDLAQPQVGELVRRLKPDAACVACFPRRIPHELLSAPPDGFFNVHPSRLPAYRGPAPLFWSLRDGIAQTGVTVHMMERTLDTGDIVGQAPVELPDGISGPEADKLLGALGGRLLVEALSALVQGKLTPIPQGSGGFYRSNPRDADFQMERTWSARRSFNFMRGTQEWGHPYLLDLGGEQITLTQAVCFDPNAELDVPYVVADQGIHIQFTPGVLTARFR